MIQFRCSVLARSLSLIAIASLGMPEVLGAQSNSINMTTSPGTLVVASATPGSAPSSNTNQVARYSVSVVTGRVKIVGQLDAPLPAGVTLTVQLIAPNGAISVGTVGLTTSPQDLVRFISVGQSSGLTVTLVLSASVGAGVVPFTSSHLILTLVDDP